MRMLHGYEKGREGVGYVKYSIGVWRSQGRQKWQAARQGARLAVLLPCGGSPWRGLQWNMPNWHEKDVEVQLS